MDRLHAAQQSQTGGLSWPRPLAPAPATHRLRRCPGGPCSLPLASGPPDLRPALRPGRCSSAPRPPHSGSRLRANSHTAGAAPRRADLGGRGWWCRARPPRPVLGHADRQGGQRPAAECAGRRVGHPGSRRRTRPRHGGQRSPTACCSDAGTPTHYSGIVNGCRVTKLREHLPSHVVQDAHLERRPR